MNNQTPRVESTKVTPTLQSAPQTSAVSNNEPAAPVAETIKEAAKVAPPLRKNPTFLRLQAFDLHKDTARIEIQTDGSKHFPVQVRIIGNPGSILERPSFFALRTLYSRADGPLTLKLSSLKLPNGTYKVIAKSEDVSTERRIFLGLNNQKFREQLYKHQKAMSYYQQVDRRQLLRLSTRLVSDVQNLTQGFAEVGTSTTMFRKKVNQAQKILRSGEYRELSNMSTRALNQKVFGEVWIELSDLHKDIQSQLSKALEESRSNDRVPELSFQSLSRKAQDLRVRLGRLSTWKS